MLNQKVFWIYTRLQGEASFLPSETSQKIDYTELIRAADKDFCKDGSVSMFWAERYILPNFDISYIEAEKLGILDLFRSKPSLEIFINREWFLKQDIWEVGIIKKHYTTLCVGITTPPATVLGFIVQNKGLLKPIENVIKEREAYLLSPEIE